MLEYDIRTEKEFEYPLNSIPTIIPHLAQFVSRLWQIHGILEMHWYGQIITIYRRELEKQQYIEVPNLVSKKKDSIFKFYSKDLGMSILGDVPKL